MREAHYYREEGAPGEGYKPPFLPKEDYARAMAKFVKFCHDAAILDKNKNVWLPHRRADKAMPGFWFIGGQMKPFVPIAESLAQVFKRETGLSIDPKRFKLVAENEYVLKATETDPAQDSWCKIFTVVLTDEEIAAIRLDPNEYGTEQVERFERSQIATLDPLRQQIFDQVWDYLT